MFRTSTTLSCAPVRNGHGEGPPEGADFSPEHGFAVWLMLLWWRTAVCVIRNMNSFAICMSWWTHKFMHRCNFAAISYALFNVLSAHRNRGYKTQVGGCWIACKWCWNHAQNQLSFAVRILTNDSKFNMQRTRLQLIYFYLNHVFHLCNLWFLVRCHKIILILLII